MFNTYIFIHLCAIVGFSYHRKKSQGPY